jgi:hypothetical protein
MGCLARNAIVRNHDLWVHRRFTAVKLRKRGVVQGWRLVLRLNCRYGR